jgi:hypothetical protein
MPALLTVEDVQPGDLFVIVPRSEVFTWIEFGERIIDRKLIKKRKAQDLPVWGHVGIASRRLAETGQLMIVQAEPGGAQEVPWPYEDELHLWSTGILPPCPGAASAALRYAGFDPGAGCAGSWSKTRDGVGYSFLDYAAIGMHANHIPAPGLLHYIETTRHMMCSQLADQCRADGGSHLFDDGRPPGYVTPLDIGLLLEGVQ